MAFRVETERFTKELCIQRLIEGGNDINWLVMCNKGTKFACSSSSSRKESDYITSCYLKSGSSNKATLEKTKKFDDS